MAQKISHAMIDVVAGIRAAEKARNHKLWCDVESRYQRLLGPDGKRWIACTSTLPRKALTTERGRDALAIYNLRREKECA